MKKVVIVDDFGTQRMLVKSILADMDLQLLECKNGKEALGLINKVNPSCVITDLEMPEMDGLEMVKSIRRTKPKNSLPVIMISSRSEKQNEALRIGVNTWITKPYDREDLIGALQSELGEVATEKSYHLLLMEEEYMQTSLWQKTLERSGFTLDKATSAKDAMNKIRTGKYDGLITEDLNPEYSGIRLIRKLKESPNYKDMPVVMIATRNAGREIPRRANIDLILNFPFNPTDVKNVLRLKTMRTA